MGFAVGKKYVAFKVTHLCWVLMPVSPLHLLADAKIGPFHDDSKLRSNSITISFEDLEL